MNIFWITVGAGVFVFLALAGYALVVRADKRPGDVFLGSILEEDNEGSLFDDDDKAIKDLAKRGKKSAKKDN